MLYERGGERAAITFTLIQTAKLNDVNPQAWLADVLARIADHKFSEPADLLPCCPGTGGCPHAHSLNNSHRQRPCGQIPKDRNGETSN
jgi:hypothetical protein